jgi:hypothetical protein
LGEVEIEVVEEPVEELVIMTLLFFLFATLAIENEKE